MVKISGKRKDRGELQVGDVVLGRYLLEKRLGSGAMGVVFKCLERVSLVEYALKLVPPELAHNADLMEDVRENFRLVHGLKHPNIASMDFLERDDDGSYFLIMEYVQGENLTRWMRRKWREGLPDAAELIHVVKQIAAALDYAHQKQILHRDIKPANVMACEDGNIKVLDFGLASKVRSSMTALSINPANTNGTPAYLSPEQFKGRYPGPAADQYALGVMTYQMFAGYLPFAADDLAVLRAAVIGDDPERPEGLPDPVWAALERALSKNPKERFENCMAFAEAVEKGFASAVSGWERGRQERRQREKLDPESLFRAGREYYDHEDYELAVRYFCQAVKQGHVGAKNNLGVCYYNGRGVAQDYGEAVKFFRRAAEQGHVLAQLNLGLCYKFGRGVAQDYSEAVKWYSPAAEQGNIEAQFELGLCYEDGRGVAQDYSKAVKWYSQAAERWHAGAQNCLGACYYCGRGVEKDYAEAVKWYRKAAEQGNAYAQYNLGFCYEYGRGVEQDYGEAFKWYSSAAGQGNSAAQNNLGECYENGRGVKKNINEAVKWYRRAAEQGNFDAQNNLGDCYEYGRGVAKDFTKALEWYQRAAEQGDKDVPNASERSEGKSSGEQDPEFLFRKGEECCVRKDYGEAVKYFRQAAEQGLAEAQYNLGLCYDNGRGVVLNYGEAVKWYRKAAERWHAGAQNQLGFCYRNGQCVEKDDTEAVKWFRRAAEQGLAEAQYRLGFCYCLGQGITQDYGEAVKWYRKAAKQGHAKAQCNLGYCYDTGHGTAQDYGEAIKWYRKAAEQGHSVAQYNLGDCYEYGRGVGKNIDEAVKWYRKAAEQGDKDAKEALERLGE